MYDESKLSEDEKRTLDRLLHEIKVSSYYRSNNLWNTHLTYLAFLVIAFSSGCVGAAINNGFGWYIATAIWLFLGFYTFGTRKPKIPQYYNLVYTTMHYVRMCVHIATYPGEYHGSETEIKQNTTKESIWLYSQFAKLFPEYDSKELKKIAYTRGQ